jgi:hypothetical protein
MDDSLILKESPEYFDQLSLATIASFSSGIVNSSGTLGDLLLTILIVRAGLLIFYKLKRPHIDGEIRLLVISAIGWLLGAAITRGHSWNTDDDHVADASMRSFNAPPPQKTNIWVNAVISLIQKLI